jgi:hypothetical protein
MSYESGSLLSIGAGATLEQVLLLSDGRVATKLFAGKPVSQRDILNLSDWLLLTEGQNITVILPLNKGIPVVAEPVYSLGTMLRWKKDDQNKRSALVMKDGVLQVKEIIDGRITMVNGTLVKRTLFKDIAEWKASLPEGGTISAEAAKPWAPSIEEKAKAPIQATTDAGYIAELSKRYLVRSSLYEMSSINEGIERTRECLKRTVARFAENMSVENNNIDQMTYYIKVMGNYCNCLQRQLLQTHGKSASELTEVTYIFSNVNKQKLFAYKGGLKYEICSKDNMIGLAPSAEGTRYRGKALVGKTFADLGIEMKDNGKPRLEVSYYRRRIEM